MATPNYSFEKRQRELAKKKKAEEKRQRKLSSPQGGDYPSSSDDRSTPNGPVTPGSDK